MIKLATMAMYVPAVCPKAPPGAQARIDELTGYVLWGVVALFVIGVVIGIGAVVAGRIFHSPHASKAGIASVVVVLLCAIAYLVMPGMVSGMIGAGCV